jgi:hypothetical protein
MWLSKGEFLRRFWPLALMECALNAIESIANRIDPCSSTRLLCDKVHIVHLNPSATERDGA